MVWLKTQTRVSYNRWLGYIALIILCFWDKVSCRLGRSQAFYTATDDLVNSALCALYVAANELELLVPFSALPKQALGLWMCATMSQMLGQTYIPQIFPLSLHLSCVFLKEVISSILVTFCPVWATCIPWYSTVIVSVERLTEFRLRSLTEYFVMVLCTSCTSLIVAHVD